MKVSFSKTAESDLKTLAIEDRRRVSALIDQLRNWNNDTTLRNLSQAVPQERGKYSLSTSSNIDIFFVVLPGLITVQSIGEHSRQNSVLGESVDAKVTQIVNDPRAGGPIRLFYSYSYSHEDEPLRDEMAKHLSVLKRQSVISEWHDRMIGVGEEWKGAIDKNLEEAQVVLLLVSSSFLASDYCYDIEMKKAIERHGRGEARVIPIIIRPCDWHDAPFGKLQGLPKDAKPVTSWVNKDEAWTDVAKGIRRAVEAMTANPR